MCNARLQTISFKYATVGITFIFPTVYSNPAITSVNGKPPLVRENAIHCCLSQRWCVRAQLTRFILSRRAKTQPTYGRRVLSPPSCKRLHTVWADIRLLCVPGVLAAVAVTVWKRLRK